MAYIVRQRAYIRPLSGRSEVLGKTIIDSGRKSSRVLDMKIAVIGLGYVGISNAILLAQNHEVVAYDVDPDKVEKINQGQSPIIDTECQQYLSSGNLNLRATDNPNDAYEDANFSIIATPTNYDTQSNASIKSGELSLKYGIDPTTANLKQLNIAELSEQPTYDVAGYVPEHDKYKPIEDQTGTVNRLNSELSAAQAKVTDLETRVLARITALEEAATASSDPVEEPSDY